MNTMKWSAIVALSLGVATSNVNALTTVGDRSCGQWTVRKQNPYAEAGSEAWLMGFMTGLAVASEKDAISDTDGDSMILWMDNYCRTHPLERLSNGAATLFFELMARKKR